MKKSGLFAIEMGRDDGQKLYWMCSTEHGTGWGDLKQSFSPSELTKEVRRLIDEGWFPGSIVIRELKICD